MKLDVGRSDVVEAIGCGYSERYVKVNYGNRGDCSEFFFLRQQPLWTTVARSKV